MAVPDFASRELPERQTRDSRFRFGLRVPACAHPFEVAGFAQRVEQAGFDVCWIPDSQFVWRDVWATLAIVASRTERITLGPAVTNFESRDVTVTAAAASTINDLAPGRLIVGVGTGDSGVKTLGLAPTRLSVMREQISALRTLLAGEVMTFGGGEGSFAERRMRIRSASGPAVPIFMAASGPKSLAFAGGVADGVMILAGAGPTLIARALGYVRQGAEAAGRTLDDLDVWLAVHTAIADGERSAARMVKPLIISSAQLGAHDALRAAGIEIEVPRVAGGVYPDMAHAESWDAAIEVAERWVTDTMALQYARQYTFSGTPESVIGRIRAAAELGIRNFYVLGYSSYEFPHDLLEAFGSDVIPALRGGREEHTR
jgi:5,10-methylenetetrahydromethanopterin reductase